MKKRKIKQESEFKLSDELYWFIDAHNNDDLSDGAWWQVLEDSVTYWNVKHGANFDENEAVHAYIDRKG